MIVRLQIGVICGSILLWKASEFDGDDEIEFEAVGELQELCRIIMFTVTQARMDAS